MRATSTAPRECVRSTRGPAPYARRSGVFPHSTPGRASTSPSNASRNSPPTPRWFVDRASPRRAEREYHAVFNSTYVLRARRRRVGWVFDHGSVDEEPIATEWRSGHSARRDNLPHGSVHVRAPLWVFGRTFPNGYISTALSKSRVDRRPPMATIAIFHPDLGVREGVRDASAPAKRRGTRPARRRLLRRPTQLRRPSERR